MPRLMEEIHGRDWWSRVRRMQLADPFRAFRFVVRAYRLHAITDYQLWEVLSNSNSPLSRAEAGIVYRTLGLEPFSGYPLSRKET